MIKKSRVDIIIQVRTKDNEKISKFQIYFRF